MTPNEINICPRASNCSFSPILRLTVLLPTRDRSQRTRAIGFVYVTLIKDVSESVSSLEKNG